MLNLLPHEYDEIMNVKYPQQILQPLVHCFIMQKKVNSGTVLFNKSNFKKDLRHRTTFSVDLACNFNKLHDIKV